MPQEVRTMQEGTLRWVQASGVGLTWATGSAPKSGLLGYVQAGFNFGYGNEFLAIYDRGAVKHNKLIRVTNPNGSFTVLEGITGDWPEGLGIATASGASVPMIHLEWRMAYTELHPSTGYYYQLMGVPWPGGITLTEQPEGNTRAYNFHALTATGPTASGYLG